MKANKRMSGIEFYKKFGILVILGGIIMLFSILASNFFNVGNIFSILRQQSFQGILAIGMVLCMLTGGVDLSVGSLTAFCGMAGALFMRAYPIPYTTFNPNPIVGALIGITAGIAWGFVNGVLINELKIPPLIATLATYESIRGLVYIISGALPIYDGLEDYFVFLGQGSLFGVIPIPVIFMLVLFATFWVILSKTTYGRHIYCVGGNEEVARLSGINVKKIKYSAYMISGAMCGIAGMLLVARTNSMQPNAALGYEFEVITACVLGGVSMNGGEGKLWGAMVGIVIMGILLNGLIQVGLNDFYREVFSGVVLVIAVGIDSYSRNHKENLAEMLKAGEAELGQVAQN